MKRVAVGMAAAMLLGLAGAACAHSVSIDFTGTRSANRVLSSGLSQVNNAAGQNSVTTIVKKNGVNVAATGGTDAARYLSLKIAPAFKQGLKSVWVTVEYLDTGRDAFRLNADLNSNAAAVVPGPSPRWKYDTQQFISQTYHVSDFRLQGGMPGGADIRIDDRATDAAADGQEFIARVTVSDEDPNFIFVPYASTKPTINGEVGAGEWNDALSFTLDRAQQDGVQPSKFTVPEEFSGVYSFKYDEDALYVLGQVRDSTKRLNTTSNGISFNGGDGFEVFMGFNEANVERTTMLTSDFHALIGLGTTPGWSAAAGTGTAQGTFTERDITNLLVVKDASDGYTFEMQIPWKSLDANLTVKQGQDISFYLFANNGIADPSSQTMALGPTGATGPSGNPSRWIRGVLDLKP